MESAECFPELLEAGGDVVSEWDTGHQSLTARTGNVQKQSFGSGFYRQAYTWTFHLLGNNSCQHVRGKGQAQELGKLLSVSILCKIKTATAK